MSTKRFWKYPPALVNKFRRLLRTSDQSAWRCAQEAFGTRNPGHDLVKRITHEERRYISRWRWVVKATGEIRPNIPPCLPQCAARKTGLSTKTIYRRTKMGLIHPIAVPSQQGLIVISPNDIEILKAVGKNPSDAHGILSRDDVDVIRSRAANGETHMRISLDYPVSRRQIGRIVDKTRWK